VRATAKLVALNGLCDSSLKFVEETGAVRWLQIEQNLDEETRRLSPPWNRFLA
jgi:hypothetical protein